MLTEDIDPAQVPDALAVLRRRRTPTGDLGRMLVLVLFELLREVDPGEYGARISPTRSPDHCRGKAPRLLS